MKKNLTLLILIIGSIFVSCSSYELPKSLKSPDKRIEVTFSLDESGAPYYCVKFLEKELIAKSYLNLKFSSGDTTPLNIW